MTERTFTQEERVELSLQLDPSIVIGPPSSSALRGLRWLRVVFRKNYLETAELPTRVTLSGSDWELSSRPAWYGSGGSSDPLMRAFAVYELQGDA